MLSLARRAAAAAPLARRPPALPAAAAATSTLPFPVRGKCSQKPKQYKLRTRNAAKKRIKVTASGKYLRWHPGKRHYARLKSWKAKLYLRGSTVVHKTHNKMLRRCLPYGVGNAKK